MLGSFEKIVWVFGVLVILLVVVVAMLFKPSTIVLSEIEHKKVEVREQEEDWAEYLRKIEERSRAGGGSADDSTTPMASVIRTKYEEVKKQYPEAVREAYSFADRKILDKYSSWGEVVQLVKKDSAVFLTDDNDKVVGIQIVELSEDSPLRTLVGLQEEDIIVSICGFLPSNLEEGEKLFNEIKNEEYFYLEVERNQRRMLLLYHIPHRK